MLQNKKVKNIVSAITLIVVLTLFFLPPVISKASNLTDSNGEQAYELQNDNESIQGTVLINGVEYETTRVFRDDFASLYSQPAEVFYVNPETVFSEVPYGKMYLDEFSVGYYDFIEGENTPIAKVHTDVDKAAELDYQRQIERVNEKIAALDSNYKTDLENADYYIWLASNNHDKEIANINKKQVTLDYEYQKKALASQLEDLQKELTKISNAINTTEITSNVFGAIGYVADIKKGSELKDNTMLLYVIPMENFMDRSYVRVDDPNGYLMEGMRVDVNCGNGSLKGDVVSGSKLGLSSQFTSTHSYIKLDPESGNIYFGQPNYRVIAPVCVEENVPIVKMSAVTIDSKGNYFVTVVNDDGTTEKVRFTPGGSNNSYVWVLDGLEEGTQLLLRK